MNTTELDIQKAVLSDIFKEIHGFRPRGIYKWDSMDMNAVSAEIERLIAYAETDEETEREEALRLNAANSGPLTHSPFAGLR